MNHQEKFNQELAQLARKKHIALLQKTFETLWPDNQASIEDDGDTLVLQFDLSEQWRARSPAYAWDNVAEQLHNIIQEVNQLKEKFDAGALIGDEYDKRIH